MSSPSYDRLALTSTFNQMEIGTGSTTTIINAPAPSSGHVMLTLPNTTDTLVGENTTNNLNNKSISSATINLGTLNNATINGCAINQKLYPTTIAASRTLYASDSGSIIQMSQGGSAAVTITLPSIASTGCNFLFILTVTGVRAITIASPTAAKIFGSVVSGATDQSAEVCLAATSITFVGSGTATVPVGAYAEFVCTGSMWHVRAFSQVVGGITVVSP